MKYRQILTASAFCVLLFLLYQARYCIAATFTDHDWTWPVKVAITLGLDTNQPCGRAQSRMLEAAVVSDNQSMVEFLLRHGAAPNVRNERGFSPIMIAAVKGNVAIAKRLRAFGASFDAKRNPQHILLAPIHNGHRPMVQYLLSSGCDAHGHEAELYIEALQGGRVDLVQDLLAGGVDPTKRGPQESTPLMWAARFAGRDTLALLIAHGADPSARDAKGRTAIDWAREGGRKDNIPLLSLHRSRM